jgi:hypothetical protein
MSQWDGSSRSFVNRYKTICNKISSTHHYSSTKPSRRCVGVYLSATLTVHRSEYLDPSGSVGLQDERRVMKHL